MKPTRFGQAGFTVVAPIKTGEGAVLRQKLAALGTPGALDLSQFVEVHFASFVIVPAKAQDQLRAQNGPPPAGALAEELVFEGNIDGDISAFFATLAQKAAPQLNDLLGHCQGFEPVRAAQYLSENDKGFSVFYVGAPGRTVGQIREEQALRDKLEDALTTNPKDLKSASDARQFLVAKAGQVAPYVRPWEVTKGSVDFQVALIAVLVILVGVLIASAVFWSPVGTLCVVIGLALLAVAALRLDEVRNKPLASNRAANPIVEQLIQREDYGINNHFASLTVIQPGPMRWLTVRFVMWAIDTLAHYVSNKGELSGIPSIYFARWVILSDRRLLFLTNFGGSWDSYLNDFIEKGHTGLTGVWSNSLGFPTTRFLVMDGATNEQGFKNYARNSQVETLYWYRAYPDLVTANIENSTRIREGLMGNMDETGARQWMQRL